MYPVLKLYVNKEYPELVELYKSQIEKHNTAIETDPHPNAGFDLYFPVDVEFSTIKSKFVDFQVKGQMVEEDGTITGYYVYPRSSISKTPLLLANNVGIIDSGYLGNLIGAFRCFEPFTTKKHERLLQICHPCLRPIRVEWIEDENDLVKTSRGENGFGSTGK